MPSTIDVFPFIPPREQKCPINELPNELLSYIFQLEMEEMCDEWDVDWEESGFSKWEGEDFSKWENVDDVGANVKSSNSKSSKVLPVDTDFRKQHGGTLPSQVLVSHVCRRWRSVALNTHRLWTELTFRMRPALTQMKEYISRSNGLPLTIELNYAKLIYLTEDEEEDLEDEEDGVISMEDEDEDDDVLSLEDSDGESDMLALQELDKILGLLKPVISQWRSFTFLVDGYIHLIFVMSKLGKFPAAPSLESFQVHNITDGTKPVPPTFRTRHLPFNGQAPKLKDVIFRGVHIDWDAALPNFLRGLRDLEFSDLRKDVRPNYAAFAEILKNSPELRTLTLSDAGPILAGNVPFDAAPIVLPSLTELVLQYLDVENATAFVWHLDMPSVTHLVFNFDTHDYSNFVRALTSPVKGRRQSLLRQITHLCMIGLTFDPSNVNLLLSELKSLKSLYLKLPMREDESPSFAIDLGTRLVVGAEYSSTTSKGSYSVVSHVKGTEIKSYYPPSTYKTFLGGIDNPFPKDHYFPIAFVAERLDIDVKSLKFRRSVVSAVRYYVIIDQAHDGITFYNAKAAVSFNSLNQVQTFGSSIVKLDPAHIASSKPTISLEDAIRIAEDTLDGNVLKRRDSTIADNLGYLAKEDGSAVLAYVLMVMDAAISRRLQAFVDAHSGCLLSIEDMVFHASPTANF